MLKHIKALAELGHANVLLLGGGCSIILLLLLYLRSSHLLHTSGNAKEMKASKAAYLSISKITEKDKSEPSLDDATMHISELYVYPIKSLRGTRVASALITAEGFYLDRRYMLLEVGNETLPKPKSMHIAKHPRMALFETSMSKDSATTFLVSYHKPGSPIKDICQLPIDPEQGLLDTLERVDVDMYGSACLAYNMGPEYNLWFSTRFGFDVILAFWGGNPRPVLGNLPGKAANDFPKQKSFLVKAIQKMPLLNLLVDDEVGIAFNDMAPFLVINENSIHEVTSRIGTQMDGTKFRPNIIVKGPSPAYEEDYWAELTFNSSGVESKSRIFLTANCVRCVSLNVDHETGEFAEGRNGQVLKLLSTDRRLDNGLKYSPVFGRYGFPAREDIGKVLRVGDQVAVSRKNLERTTFAWKGITG